jgi:T5SS/PEP-CTERM-associated repeat protein
MGRAVVTPGTRLEVGSATLGGVPFASGTLNVDGAGAAADISFVLIGNGGEGIVNVSRGGVVTSGSAAQQSTTLGNAEDSDGLLNVTGAGSVWNTRSLEVGRGGRGEVDIDNGGGIVGGSLVVGRDANSRGVVTVRGSNSALVITNAARGAGYAQVNIDPGAAVYLNGGATGKYQIANTNLNGGTLRVSTLTTPINFNAGTLQVTGGAGLAVGPAAVPGQSTVNADVAVPAGGTLEVSGPLNVAANRHLSVNTGGVIDAGAAAAPSAGSLNNGTIDVLRGTFVARTLLLNDAGATFTAVDTDRLDFKAGLDNSGTVNLVRASAAGAITNEIDGSIFVAGAATFADKVTNHGAIAAAGSVNFQGGLTNDGSVTVTGTQTAAPAAATVVTSGGIDGAGNLTVGAGATAVTPAVAQTAVHVAPGARLVLLASPAPTVSTVQSLRLDPGGTLDVADNRLVVDYADAASPLATVRAAVLDKSITSSALTPATAIGYAEAFDLPQSARPATADATSVVVRQTLLGDANLDGAVDFDDLVKLAQNYNAKVSVTTEAWWSHGDFTGDGTTDFNDLVKLAQNYNAALPSRALPGASAGFETDLTAAFASVPEPSAAVATTLAGVGVLSRRRRRR